MRRTPLIPALTAMLVLLALAAPPARGAATSISGLSATVSGGSISVGGTVSFGGEDPIEVGTDAVNDNAGGAQTAALGIDVQRLLLSQPDPNTPTLQFVFDLSAMTSDGIPEHVAYNWDIRVNGGEPNDGADRSIKTWRTKVASTTNASPYAAVFTCVPSGTGSSCTAGPTVPVVYDGPNSQIRMSVPLSTIEASPGSTIDAWLRISAPVWTGGTAATQTLAGLYDTATHDQYVVPSKTVQVGIASAGSPISYTSAASLSGNGFTGTLAAPGPGSYDVGARACFASNCATSTTTITIG